jgi:hypothetical protein
MGRKLGEALGIVAITVALGEIAFRVVLGVQPLTTESLVWQPHPRWGWSHRPGVEDVFVKLGCRQLIRINSLGLREREIPYEKRDDVFRVLVIGDSVVAGFEVPPESVYTRVAEDRLQTLGSPTQFINGGHRGFGSDQALLFLMDEGMRYEPDLVLYHWTHNDRDDNATVHRPFRAYGKGYFDLDEDGALVLRGTPVATFPYDENLRVGEAGEVQELPVSWSLRASVWLRDHTVVRSSLATALMHIVAGLPQLAQPLRRAGSYGDFRDPEKSGDDNRLFRVTAAIVEKMRRRSAEAGAGFRLIGPRRGWPERIRAELSLPEVGEFERFRDATPKGARLHIPMDPHWNELGHELYGAALADALLAQELVPAPGEEAVQARRRLGGVSGPVPPVAPGRGAEPSGAS